MGQRSIGVNFAPIGVTAVTISPGSNASGDGTVAAITLGNAIGDSTDCITVSAGRYVRIQISFATILVVLITIVVTDVA